MPIERTDLDETLRATRGLRARLIHVLATHFETINDAALTELAGALQDATAVIGRINMLIIDHADGERPRAETKSEMVERYANLKGVPVLNVPVTDQAERVAGHLPGLVMIGPDWTRSEEARVAANGEEALAQAERLSSKPWPTPLGALTLAILEVLESGPKPEIELSSTIGARTQGKADPIDVQAMYGPLQAHGLIVLNDNRHRQEVYGITEAGINALERHRAGHIDEAGLPGNGATISGPTTFAADQACADCGRTVSPEQAAKYTPGNELLCEECWNAGADPDDLTDAETGADVTHTEAEEAAAEAAYEQAPPFRVERPDSRS